MAFLTHTHPAGRCTPRRIVTFSSLLALHRQRRALGKLDQASLDDIGLSRSQAETEARRPFWDIPAQWLK